MNGQSTVSPRSRKSLTGKPAKPYAKFPLTPHAGGAWQKKIRGKIKYFGRWGRVVKGTMERLPGDGWKDALELYKAKADDLHAGRTPRVNRNAGRDHWTYCYSAVLAGAGIRGGTVYGESDSQAAFVKSNPVSPADLCATIYAILGINPELRVFDRTNRPVEIAHGGRPLREIMA